MIFEDGGRGRRRTRKYIPTILVYMANVFQELDMVMLLKRILGIPLSFCLFPLSGFDITDRCCQKSCGPSGSKSSLERLGTSESSHEHAIYQQVASLKHSHSSIPQAIVISNCFDDVDIFSFPSLWMLCTPSCNRPMPCRSPLWILNPYFKAAHGLLNGGFALHVPSAT